MTWPLSCLLAVTGCAADLRPDPASADAGPLVQAPPDTGGSTEVANDAGADASGIGSQLSCDAQGDCPPSYRCAQGACVATPPLTIVTATLDLAFTGEPYRQQLELRGGISPFTWRLAEAPPWIGIDDEGRLHGEQVPGPPATYSLTAVVADASGAETRREYLVTVQDRCETTCDAPGAPQQRQDCSCGCGDGDPCADGQLCCGGGCVDPQTHAQHCGACGEVCAVPANGTPACSAGACGVRCAPGYGDCDGDPTNGCEADLGADPHCGRCGNDCVGGAFANGAATCVAGVCVLQCSGDFEDCDGDVGNGCEVDVGTDTENCGGCARICPDLAHIPRRCDARECTTACENGWHDCNGNPADGCEAALGTVEHCSACNDACVFGEGPARGQGDCRGGRCVLTLCIQGRRDCNGNPQDGCEIDSLNDPDHCGECGNPCAEAVENLPAQACEQGECCSQRGGLCGELDNPNVALCCQGLFCSPIPVGPVALGTCE